MSTTSPHFTIVGVGASAGGIDSFKKFLSGIPPNSNIAYILIQHLEPSHESKLTEILSKHTDLAVKEIENGTKIVPNTIFVLPANKTVTAGEDDTLVLKTRDTRVKNLPIDLFFESLSNRYGTRAIGVVLSGTATDGTLGLKYIMEQGGLTFVQKPENSGWSAMPQNAIDAEVVDFVLSADEIIPKILLLKDLHDQEFIEDDKNMSKKEEEAYRQILSLIKLHGGIDFNYYKQPTLRRRIARRMSIVESDSLNNYLLFLRKNAVERDLLLQDMLIQVTSFFRDIRTFKELKESVFPKLIANIQKEGSIRMWIPGCATGEEAYSLVICLHDAIKESGSEFSPNTVKIQVFASDVSESAIERARSGIYSATDLQALSEIQLKTYFTKLNGEFKVDKAVRDCIVFATHNFLKDPPFARIDLISCRNVFIYLEPYLQKKALTTFHYALTNTGFLVLEKLKPQELLPIFMLHTLRKSESILGKRGRAILFHPLFQIQNPTRKKTK